MLLCECHKCLTGVDKFLFPFIFDVCVFAVHYLGSSVDTETLGDYFVLHGCV